MTTHTCPPDETLAALADGTLSDDQRDGLLDHLATCDSCRRLSLGLVQDLESDDGVPARPVAPVMTAIDRASATPTRSHWMRYATLAAASLIAAIGLAALWGSPDPDKPARPVSLAELGPADRGMVHLSTDRPIYRPAEPLFVRGVVLTARDRRPVADGQRAGWQITGPRGDVVAGGGVQTVDSVCGFAWIVPRSLPGGVYTLRCGGETIATGETTFEVRDYRLPKLRTELDLDRKSYGAGETVTATLTATRAAGGIPSGARVTVVATVDGAEAHRSETRLGADGRCRARFALPETIARGEATLSMVVRDGGVVETAARSIPVALKTLELAFFPEGGDLVTGLPTRVYFQARQRGDVADVRGRILDDRDREVARFASTHEGRGRFAITPAPGRTYRAVLDAPEGIEQEVALPAARARGVTLRATRPAFGGGPIAVELCASSARQLRVEVARREQRLARQTVRLEARQPKTVELPVLGDGALRVTVYDADAGTPLAERLVFRRPQQRLNVELTVRPERAEPGDEVTVSVRTTDETGQPVPATVGLSVSDDSTLSMVESRRRAPRLPAQVLLGAEVAELLDAQAVLDDPAKLDLLLGTQGWRRFAFVDVARFLKDHGALAERALGFTGGKTAERARAELARLGRDLWLSYADTTTVEPPDARRPLNFAWRLLHDGTSRPPVTDFFGPAIRLQTGVDTRHIAFGGWGYAKLDGFFALRDARALGYQGVMLREYAHRAQEAGDDGSRRDFTETVYWNAGTRTDSTGRLKVTFRLSDSVTTFRVRADGFGARGALGQADAAVVSRRAFHVDAKCPLEVTSGDVIDLPVTLTNGTATTMAAELRMQPGKGLSPVGRPTWRGEVPANGSRRVVLTLRAEHHTGDVAIDLVAHAGERADKVVRRVRIAPAGFPRQVTYAGMLGAGERPGDHTLRLPEIVPGSLKVVGTAYPSPAATLGDAIRALVREPHGCFEQTSATAYPNALALKYLTSLPDADEPSNRALIATSRANLARGLKRLSGFECASGGFEWFGSDPAHEGLTAFGVLEFADMAAVGADVDPAMRQRTLAWLLSRRDGKGHFRRSGSHLHSWGAPQDVHDAYILWALTTAGVRTGLDRELASLRARAAKSRDAYLLALAAGVQQALGAPDAGLLDRLARMQRADGRLIGRTKSITCSTGRSLAIETTALAVLAWLPSKAHQQSAALGLRWILGARRDGMFGTTQGTVLALKAILAAEARSRPTKDHTLSVRIDDREARVQTVAAGAGSALALPLTADTFRGSEHRIRLTYSGEPIPYGLTVTYHTRTPLASEDCALSLKTALAKTEVPEGEAVDLQVTVTNGDADAPTPIAIVGIPGGLEVRHEQLQELVRAGTIAAYDVRGRDVVLYWRGMKAGAKTTLALSCVAAVPGRYTAPASRAYLYYTPEHVDWQPGLSVHITR